VSGFVLNFIGGAAVAGEQAEVLVNGTNDTALSMASGANGYYYDLLAPGTISNSQVLVYLGGTDGAALADNASGSITGLDIYSHTLNEVTSAAEYSTVQSDLAAAIGSNTSVQTIVDGLANLAIDSSASTFTIDSAINIGAGNLTLTTGSGENLTLDAALTGSTVDLISGGQISQNSAGLITASAHLAGSSVGGATLTAANLIGGFDAFTNTGGGNVSLTDAQSLYIGTGGVNAGSGTLTLTTTGAGHNLSVTNALTGGVVDLVSAGTISESGAGLITASAHLAGSSVGGATLNAANLIGGFDALTNTGGGNVSLTDAQSLYIGAGGVNAGSGTLTLTTTGAGHNLSVTNALTGGIVDLVSAGTIKESGAGLITASAHLAGSSVGGATLTDANLIGGFDAFTNTGGGNVSLTDAQSLYIGAGGVNAGSGTLTLTTTGAGHNLSVANTLTGGTISLTSAGNVTEGSSGAVIANLLNVTADSGISLTASANDITTIGTNHTNSGPDVIVQH
jgi:hypothetical protein